MALGKHKKDDKGTVVVDDAMYQALVDMLWEIFCSVFPISAKL
jgi:hypothetical protein